MNKDSVNKYLRKFGFEIHGTGYMYKILKTTFKEDAFEKQQEILGKEASIIFDIGANRGDTVLEYRQKFPGSIIYAFEPFPDSYNIMADKIKSLPNINLIQKAAADKTGKSTLYVNNLVDTNSLLPSNVSGLSSDKLVANKGTIEVDICTVDQFCKENAVSQIDILKLDIQGGELAALKGCEEMLAGKKIKLIYTEAYFVQQYVGQPTFYDIAGYLYQHDYRLQDIYNPYYGKGSIAWCDAIFLPVA